MLDEFQHAKSLMLASGVKRVIDDIKFERDPHAKVKIVFAGSHQQKILEMLHHPQAPLFQRVNHLQAFILCPLLHCLKWRQISDGSAVQSGF